ncbi:spore germination protein KA [Paraliobacillus quinghaiensis]|uniref:Spore germination protein KA n=1 Tax=Paraliobacillus quinghaiensis TaxID=470815 RepID=A0A917TIE0_9BACI|nr:spore germination protein [Paraliobacillus quinghaiensis]GGM24349.1 spore germination protein KA [Paraliobacillus quinghaiensis]
MFKKVGKRNIAKSNQSNRESKESITLHSNLTANLDRIKQDLPAEDVIIREFKIGTKKKTKAGIIYVSGLVDKQMIQDYILESLMIEPTNLKQIDNSDAVALLKDSLLTIGKIEDIFDFEDLYNELLSGNSIILLDGEPQGFSTSTRGWEDRGVTEPSTQNVIRGPKDSFTETLLTNITLIRRRIKDINLRLEMKKIGRRTKTDVAIMYINGVADEKVVKEVQKRLDRIDIDAVLESGYIEELIQDETYTPFPTIYNSERPDVIAGNLLEGRIAIIVDGTPFVLVVPALFIQFFQSSEDYYQRADLAFLVRLIRYLAFFLSLVTPSAYIAVTTFHQEMLQTQLLISLAEQREGVPFPAFLEALLMEITFEILREAGLRMPKAIGPAISIVGALVLGQAAVEAGIVSASMVIVVSLTAISSFVMPAYNLAITFRMLRFVLMGLAASFGLFGIILGLITMVLHLCSLRSFGVPYLTPFAPFEAKEQKDVIFRMPLWGMTSRPRSISKKNVKRQQPVSKAKPKPR